MSDQGADVREETAMVPPVPSPAQTIMTILVLIPIVAGFIALGVVLGIKCLYMGFLFATYWGAVKGMAKAEFFPTLLGALAAIGIAYLLHALPQVMGAAGLVIALAATIVPVYFLIRQQLTFVFNVALVVFLTVATIPALSEEHDHVGMVLGVLAGAAYSGAILLLVQWLTSLRRPKVQPA